MNFQLKSPEHISHGINDHYVTVDFTGWRYFELVEPESERYSDYRWPYGSAYSIYRENVDFGRVETFSIYCNDLPREDPIECRLRPIKALPFVPITIRNPAFVISGKKICFPVVLKTGQYLECFSLNDCKVYSQDGELIREVTPDGSIPDLMSGENEIQFTCDGPSDVSTRVRVTVISYGDPI